MCHVTEKMLSHWPSMTCRNRLPDFLYLAKGEAKLQRLSFRLYVFAASNENHFAKAPVSFLKVQHAVFLKEKCKSN